MIVDLGNGIHVNPAHVVAIRRSFYETHVIVTDVLGKTHEIQRGYGESIWETEARIVKMLNGK